MRCQHQYDPSPDEQFASQCDQKAEAIVKFCYRNGEAVERLHLCAYHARIDTENLNMWGTVYGHSAEMI